MKQNSISILLASVLSLSLLSTCTAAQKPVPAAGLPTAAATAGRAPAGQSLDAGMTEIGRLWSPLFAANPASVALAPLTLALEMGSLQIAGSLLTTDARQRGVPAQQTRPARVQPTALEQTQVPQSLGDQGATPRRGPGGMPPAPKTNPPAAPQPAAPQAPTPQGAAADPNQAAVAKVLADPNGVLARLAASPGDANALKQVDEKARLEDQAWEVRTRDNRSTLAYAIEHQFEDEMAVVRKIANEEKADKTVADINDLLAKRHKRFAAIAEDLRAQRPTTPSTTTRGTTRGRGRNTTTGRGRGTTTGVTPNEAMPVTEPARPSNPAGRSGAARRPQEPNQAGLDPETLALVQAWAGANYEDKRDLLKTVNESDLKDLGTLDVVATGEKAERTSLAIEALMVMHQQRVTRINEQMAKEDQRLQRQQDRGTTTGTRGTRGAMPGQPGMTRGGR